MERYKVAIGYPSNVTNSGMVPTPKLRGHLTQEHFGAWCLVMDSLAHKDKDELQGDLVTITRQLPPVSYIPGLLDVVIGMYAEGDAVRQRAALSSASITTMVEFLKHWNAVEDELEKEQAAR